MTELNLRQFKIPGELVDDRTAGMTERVEAAISREPLDSRPIDRRIQHALPDVIRIAKRAVPLAKNKICWLKKDRPAPVPLQKAKQRLRDVLRMHRPGFGMRYDNTQVERLGDANPS